LRRLIVLTVLAGAVACLCGCPANQTAAPAQTPAAPASAPSVSSIGPSAVTAGGSSFLLTINGTGFVSGAQAYVNAVTDANKRSTTFVSAMQLQVILLAADIAAPGTVPVTVVNPDGSKSSFTLTVGPPPTPNNSLLSGPFVLQETAIDPATGDQTAVAAAINFNGAGGFVSCTDWVNSPTQRINGLGCTGTYTAFSDSSVVLNVTPAGQTGAYSFSGFIDSQSNVDVIKSAAPPGVGLFTSSGKIYKQDLTQVGLSLQAGGWAGMFNGVVNGQYMTGLMRYDLDTLGSGTNLAYDFGYQNSVQNSSAGSVFLSATSPTTGATGSATIELDGPFNAPFPDLTFLNSGVFIVIDAKTQLFISTDQRSTTQPVLTGFLKRQMTGLNTASSLSGPVIGGTYGFTGSGSSITNGIQIFQFTADGAGNLPSGTTDQYNAGTLTSNIQLTGSS